MPAIKKSTKHSLGNGKRLTAQEIKEAEKQAKERKAAKKASTKKGKGK
jgi:hypothetical protein